MAVFVSFSPNIFACNIQRKVVNMIPIINFFALPSDIPREAGKHVYIIRK